MIRPLPPLNMVKIFDCRRPRVMVKIQSQKNCNGGGLVNHKITVTEIEPHTWEVEKRSCTRDGMERISVTDIGAVSRFP